MSQIEKKDITNQIIENFQSFESSLNGSADSSVHKRRQDAIKNFENKGFPTLKHEDWKYTNVSFVKRFDFDFENPDAENLTIDEYSKFIYDGFDFDLAVIINGKFSEKHSRISGQKGITIKNFKDALIENKEDIEKHFAMYANYEKNAFTAINTALTTEGIFIKVDKNAIVEKPIHVLYINKAGERPLWVNSRNLIIAERSSEATIFETTHNISDKEVLSNPVSEVYVDENAKFEYYKIQDDNEKSFYIGSTSAKQEKDSKFAKTTISLSGKFVRNTLHTEQNGTNCLTNYFGVFCINDRNFVDNHTFVDHAKPDCMSDENYRGILEDSAYAVFNGKILVRQDAQRTNAYQSNKNVLLSDNATINTKPELEIYADDVKCSHGATSGALEEEYVFYLQSRGIDKKRAQAILLNAFAQEVVDKIKLPRLKEIISSKIENRLGIA